MSGHNKKSGMSKTKKRNQRIARLKASEDKKKSLLEKTTDKLRN